MKHPNHEGQIIHTEVILGKEYTFSTHPIWNDSMLVEKADGTGEGFIFFIEDTECYASPDPAAPVAFEIAIRLLKSIMVFI